MRTLRRFVFLLSAISLATHVQAQSTEKPTDHVATIVAGLDQSTIRKIRNNKQRFLQQMAQQLFSISPDGVVTRDLLQVKAGLDIARQRAQRLSQLLAYDLNGNTTIEKDEIEQITPMVAANERSILSLMSVSGDSDKDGSFNLTEIIAYVDAQIRTSSGRRAIDFMRFDVNSDGRVDLNEISTVADRVISSNAEGKSQDAVRSADACELPKPKDNVKTVLLSGYGANALSTMAVSGVDRSTWVASIIVEKGDAPLMIIVSAYAPMIWKVGGATDRIWKFIVQPSRATGAAAVAGLPKEKIEFIGSSRCFKGFHKRDSGDAKIAIGKVSSLLGQKLDHIVASYGLNGILIPSGSVRNQAKFQAYKNGQAFTLGGKRYLLNTSGLSILDDDGNVLTKAENQRAPIRSMMRFNPGGVYDFKSEDLVGSEAIVEYDVLPKEAGLLQLLTNDQLRRTEDGYYLIQKPIARFPAGLSGAHSVRFILGKDLELPNGKPGHSSVISEETGECLMGPRCR